MEAYDVAELHTEMGMLGAHTSKVGWDEDDDKGSAKPIGQRQWAEAWVLVGMLSRIVEHLPRPTPGADPKGFIWLTWDVDSRRFALELNSSLLGYRYKWTQTTDGMRCVYSSSEVRALIEALRATFPTAMAS